MDMSIQQVNVGTNRANEGYFYWGSFLIGDIEGCSIDGMPVFDLYSRGSTEPDIEFPVRAGKIISMYTCLHFCKIVLHSNKCCTYFKYIDTDCKNQQLKTVKHSRL